MRRLCPQDVLGALRLLAATALISWTLPVLALAADPPRRFASLKTDRVTVRQLPAATAPILWTFHRIGWPVEVLRESAGFAEVRDSDGSVGWVSAAHLSWRRTAVVLGASPAHVVLRAESREGARAMAELEPGLQAVVVGCDGRWCRLTIGDVRGWLEQTRLWGVYAGERFE